MMRFEPTQDAVFGEDEFASVFAEPENPTDSEDDAAWELLGIENEEDLGKWLNKAIRSTKRAAGPLSQALQKGALAVVKRAAPVILSNFVPGGGMVGSAIGQVLGAEAEGMSEAEARFAAAKGVVRTLRDLTNRIASDPKATNNPNQAVSSALRAAVQRNLPGLITQENGHAKGRVIQIRPGETLTIQGG